MSGIHVSQETPLQVLANSHTHQLVPIDQIGLDRDNPRIKKFIEMHGENPTPKQFYLALGTAGDDEDGNSSANFQKLKNSIFTNKGIIQPVILNKRDGKLVCIEGNTRVALYRQFKEEGAPGPWDTIPALVYENMEDNDVDAIRLQVHLVGTRAWDPYSKAKYLHHLRYKKDLPMGWIVDFCGGRQKEVTESIQAFIDMEQYYRPIVDEGNFDTSRFSGFIELQKPGIKQAMSEAGFETDDFGKWIAAEKFPQLQMVRQLPRILKHPKAKAEFLKTGRDARHAASFLEQPTVSKALADATLPQLAAALKNSIYILPFMERDKICKDPGGEAYQQLSEALDALRSLLNA
jgi:hypothetical protein